MAGRKAAGTRLGLDRLEARDVPAAVGGLDPSFASSGEAVFPGAVVNAVVVQPDGKVVVAGALNSDFFVERLNLDGTPDTSFGTAGNGRVTVDVGSAHQPDVANAVRLDSSGKILVAGTGGSAAGKFALVRLSSDGKTVEINKAYTVGSGASAASGVDVQSDGTIVLAGTATNPGGSKDADIAVIRVNGSTNAITGSAAFFANPGADSGNGVAVYHSGPNLDKIVAVGTAVGDTDPDIALFRLNSDGTPDTSFNGGDAAHLYNFGANDAGRAVAIDASGNIVAVGSTDGADPAGDIAVMRVLSSNSVVDTSFNGGGLQVVDVNGADDGRAVVLQPDGKVVVVGDDGTPADVVIARLNANGTRDTSFGTNGVTTIDVNGSGSDDRGFGAGLGLNGRIVVAGTALPSEGFAVRLGGAVEESRNIVVGGSPDGAAKVYTASGGVVNATPAAVSPFGLAVDVRTATADVNGDGIPDTILVTGPRTPIRLAVVSGADNSTLLVSPFDPFGGGFTGGGFVTAADFNNDGRAEVVVTPDISGGPRVVVFGLSASGSFDQLASFLGINDANFRGGARAGAGDVNADGVADLVISAGFGGGPRIAVFDGRTLFSPAATRLTNDFFAFEGALRDGAFVAVGDVDGDGFADLVFGSGDGGGPRVLIASGRQVMSVGGDAAVVTPFASFFSVGSQSGRGGVRVAVADIDGDNRADVVTGSGRSQPAQARVYLGRTVGGFAEPGGSQDLNPFPGTTPLNGVFVG